MFLCYYSIFPFLHFLFRPTVTDKNYEVLRINSPGSSLALGVKVVGGANGENRKNATVKGKAGRGVAKHHTMSEEKLKEVMVQLR